MTERMKVISAKVSMDLLQETDAMREALEIETRNEFIIRALKFYIFAIRNTDFQKVKEVDDTV